MELMKLMDCFSQVTHASLKDCFIGPLDIIYFIVEENDIGQAVGKSGNKAKMLEKILNRKIKIVEFNPDVLQFIKNLAFPLRIKEIRQDGATITIMPIDLTVRGQLIGRGGQSLRNMEQIVRRYFDIETIKVQ